MLSAGLVTVAYLVPNPVGSNSARLAELLAPPALVAVSPLSGRVVAVLCALILVPQPLLYLDEVRARGEPALHPAFYASLIDQLEARRITGPLEVVPMRRHGESAAVALVVPLARGWLRQVDVGRNGVFYDGGLDPETYRRWLDDNAVSWVAIARGEHDWAAGREAVLVRSGLPYLREVWANQTWIFYRVSDSPVVPARNDVSRDVGSVTLDLPAAGVYDLGALVEVAFGIHRMPRGQQYRVDAGRRRTGEVVRIASSLLPGGAKRTPLGQGEVFDRREAHWGRGPAHSLGTATLSASPDQVFAAVSDLERWRRGATSTSARGDSGEGPALGRAVRRLEPQRLAAVVHHMPRGERRPAVGIRLRVRLPRPAGRPVVLPDHRHVQRHVRGCGELGGPPRSRSDRFVDQVAWHRVHGHDAGAAGAPERGRHENTLERLAAEFEGVANSKTLLPGVDESCP